MAALNEASADRDELWTTGAVRASSPENASATFQLRARDGRNSGWVKFALKLYLEDLDLQLDAFSVNSDVELAKLVIWRVRPPRAPQSGSASMQSIRL